MKNLIVIPQKYLFFRSEAQGILRDIFSQKRIPKIIELDFSQVKFVSRSFIDEFLNIVEEAKRRGVTVKAHNLAPIFKKLKKIVERKKSQIQKVFAEA